MFHLFKQKLLQQTQVLALKVERSEEKMNHELESLLIEIENFTTEAALKAEEDAHTAEVLLMILSTVSILIGIGFGWLVSSSNQQRLEYIGNSLGHIAKGDFRVTLTHNDKIGIPMRLMRDHLATLITNMNRSIERLTSTATHLTSVIHKTNVHIIQQQANTEQVSVAMTEMSATVRHVSVNIQTVSTMANKSNAKADYGASIVTEAIKNIVALSTNLNEAATIV